MTKYQIISTPNGIRARVVIIQTDSLGFNPVYIQQPQEYDILYDDFQHESVPTYIADTPELKFIGYTPRLKVGSIVEGEIINGKLKIK